MLHFLLPEVPLSALIQHFGPTLPSALLTGIEGNPTTCRRTLSLHCCLGALSFTHSFSVIPQCPIPLLGRDIMQRLQTCLQIAPDPILIATLQPILPSQTVDTNLLCILPLVRHQVNSIVWNQEIPGRESPYIQSTNKVYSIPFTGI